MHDTITFVYARRNASTAVKEIQLDLTQKAFRVARRPLPTGRQVVALREDTLDRLEPPRSWLLVVLVETEDDVARVGAWTKPRGLDAAARVRFYFPPGADMVAGVEPWRALELPAPAASHYSSVPGFRHDIGVAINGRIENDFR